MRFPAPARRGQPAEPCDVTTTRAGRLVGVAGLAAGLAALLPGALVAQACPSAPGEMCDLGTLRADSSGESIAWAVNADGSIVVGSTLEVVAGPSAYAFRWSSGTRNMQNLERSMLDVSPNQGTSKAFGVNSDGSIVVGRGTDHRGYTRAFRWDADSGTKQDLGILAADDQGYSTAYGVSADGSIVVGWAETDKSLVDHAFRWDAATDTMQDLGTLRADNSGTSYAENVNADGSIVVGISDTDGSNRLAFRWDAGTGTMQDLGTLRSDNSGRSWAYGVNADGSIVVGDAATDGGLSHAFRWDASSGTMQDLGTLKSDNSGFSSARDVNADGSIVVGLAHSDFNTNRAFRGRAFRWDASTGTMQDLGTLKSHNGGISRARGVNAEGTVVVGDAENDDGERRAFIWRAGTMLDHVNTGIAVQQSAQALAATAAHYGQNTVYQLGREVALRGPGDGDGARVSTRGEAAPQRPVAVRVGGRLAHTDDVATSGGADVTAAVGLTPTLTLGGFVEITGESDSHSVVSLDGTHIAGGASLRYRAAPDGTGLTWRVAAVRGGGDFDVTRRAILPNTQRGEGATSLTTTGLSAEIGYGYAVPRGVVTPFARLTGSRVERDGFAETNAIAFPLTYDAHEDEALTLTLGADARLDVSARGTLELGAGISHDLDRDTDPVTGTSAIPGFTNFSVNGPDLENRTRGYVSAGYSHALGAGRAVSGRVSVSQSPWTDDLSVGARLGYEMRF